MAATNQPIVLTPRDFEILTLVGLVGYAAQDQLQRTFFSSSDRCRKRTKLLARAGYLRVTLSGSRSPHLFSLTSRGRRALAGQHPELGERVRLAGAINLAGVPHHLGVVDMRLYLSALCPSGLLPVPGAEGQYTPARLQMWVNAGSRYATRRGFGALRLEPDGLAEVMIGDRPYHYAAEVDCRATESTTVFSEKLRRYGMAFEDGLVSELWILVKATERRAATIARLVRSAELNHQTRIFALSDVLERPVLSPVSLVSDHSVEPLERPDAATTLGTHPPIPISPFVKGAKSEPDQADGQTWPAADGLVERLAVRPVARPPDRPGGDSDP